MSNPLDLNKLVKFDDTTPIDNVINRLTALNSVYDDLIASAVSKSAKYTEALEEVAAAALKLEKQIGTLDASEKDHQDTIAKSAAQADKLLDENDAYTLSLKEQQDQILLLTDQVKKLSSAKEKLKNENLAEKGSLAALKAELKAATDEFIRMGDATEQVVKDEQLKKINELARQVNTVEKALKTARQGTITAAGSYNQLAQEVAAAKARLKEMDGGIGSNSKEFKSLQKFVADGTDKLKDFDKAIGDNTRNVGNYQDAIGALPGPFQQAISGIQGFTKAGLAFIATPVGAIIGALAVALGSLMAYFKGSVEGQDDFNKVLRIGEAIFETIMDVVEEFGKILFDAISEPQKIFDALGETLSDIGAAITDVFTNPVKYIKELGNLILENIINRFKAIGVAGRAIVKIFNGDIAEGFKELGNAAIQGFTGVENVIDKVIDSAKATAEEIKRLADLAAAEFARRIALAEKIAALENKIRKDKIADIVDDAKTELSVNRLILESKDKLRKSDEQRLQALRTANQQLEDQLAGDLQLIRDEIALQKLVIEQTGDTYEEREKLANLQADEIQLQSQFLQQRKRRQAEEIALIREIQKEREDRIVREKNAQLALNKFLLDAEVKHNQEILADERSTNEERIAAITDLALAQDELAKMERDRQLDIAREAAIARIQLDGETNDKIFNNRSLSITQQLALERDAKIALLEQDAAFVDERERIQLQFNQAIEDITKNAAKLVQQNAFKKLKEDFEELAATAAIEASEVNIALNQAFQDGNLSINRILAERTNFQEDFARRALESQLDYLEKQKATLESYGMDVTAIDKQIAETRLAISSATTDKLIEDQQRFNQAIEDIGFQVAQTAGDFFAAQTDRNVAALEGRLAAEEEAAARSIAIVGDDAQAKALIEQELARKKEEINRQIAQQRRRQAIFERSVTIAEIAFNTAKGISAAVAQSPITFGLPWSAFVAVTGALQLASVLAQPLPAFWKGTENSPEGFALVGERGRELIISPSGETSIADGPTVAYLEKGSQVKNNAATESILRDAERFGDGYLMDQVLHSYARNARALTPREPASIEGERIISAVTDQTRRIERALKTMPRDVFDEKGFRSYESTVAGRVVRLDKRYKLGK